MKFFRWLTRLFREQQPAPSRGAGFAACGSTGAGIDVAALLGAGCDLSQSVATSYRCVKLLCDSVAQLPLRHMRLRNGVFEEDTTSRLAYLLRVQPNPRQGAYEFWSRVTEDIVTKGEAYAVPMYAGIELERIAYVAPESVAYDQASGTYAVADSVNGVAGSFAEEEILRFLWKTDPSGRRGVGVLEAARLALGIAGAGDRRQLNNFRNGTVKGIITNPPGGDTPGWGEYQDEELAKVAKELNSDFASDGIVAARGSVGFTQLGVSSADMQFLESRRFTVREICRFYGVHPSFVFDDTSNNYKSAEMANAAFLSSTLNPLLRRIEGELLRKLAAPSLAMKRKFEFDRAGLYACDLESKADYYAKMIGSGLMTPNEARSLENLPQVEFGDRALVSANLRFLDEGGQTQNASADETGIEQ